MPAVAVRNLLISLDAYPQGWIQEEVGNDPTYDPDARTTAYAQFRPSAEENMRAFHIVLWYRSDQLAAQAHERLVKRDAESGFEWKPQPQRIVGPENADASPIACISVVHQAQASALRCKAIMRYGSYISVLVAPIDETHLGENDYLHILESIDERMATVANQQ